MTATAPTTDGVVKCSCVPTVPAAQHKLTCVACKKRFHFPCTTGLPMSEAAAFAHRGSFECAACAIRDREYVQLPAKEAFPCCGATFAVPDTPCFPCAGCDRYFHATCTNVTDASLTAQLQLYHTRWYCVECTPAFLGGGTSGGKAKKRGG